MLRFGALIFKGLRAARRRHDGFSSRIAPITTDDII